jgi:hypothetical protein
MVTFKNSEILGQGLSMVKDMLKIVLDEFKDFFRRAMMPSLVFVTVMILLGANEILKISENRIILNKEMTLLILLIGVSYLFAIGHQILFDNNTKENYDECWFCAGDKQLRKLRNEVTRILKCQYSNLIDADTKDYHLYQIIGKLSTTGSGDKKSGMQTESYTDRAKQGGITLLSIGVALTYIIVHNTDSITIIKNIGNYKFILLAIIWLLVYCIGRYYVQSTYKSRAIRIYTNFILEHSENRRNLPACYSYYYWKRAQCEGRSFRRFLKISRIQNSTTKSR